MAELPFLKKKRPGAVIVNEVSTMPDDSEDMLDGVCEELLMAIQKKDIGMLKEALRAFLYHIQSDEKQDEQS